MHFPNCCPFANALAPQGMNSITINVGPSIAHQSFPLQTADFILDIQWQIWSEFVLQQTNLSTIVSIARRLQVIDQPDITIALGLPVCAVTTIMCIARTRPAYGAIVVGDKPAQDALRTTTVKLEKWPLQLAATRWPIVQCTLAHIWIGNWRSTWRHGNGRRFIRKIIGVGVSLQPVIPPDSVTTVPSWSG